MNDRYGPWTTALGPSGTRPELGHLWKARMAHLAHAERDPTLTRRDLLRLGLAGASLAALPTLRPTAADDAKPPGRRPITLSIAWMKVGDVEPMPRGVYAIDPDTGATNLVHPPPATRVLAPRVRLSADGSRMAYTTDMIDEYQIQPHPLWIDAVAGGAVRKFINGGDNPVWSPDGKRLLFRINIQPETWEADTWIMNFDDERVHAVPIPKDNSVNDWSPDGEWLGAQDHDNIYVIHPDGTGKRRLTDADSNSRPRFSPDGRAIAFECWVKGITHLDVIDVDGTNRRRIYEERDDTIAEHPCWSPDGRQVVATLRTWNLRENGPRFFGVGEFNGNPGLAVFSRDQDWAMRRIRLPRIEALSPPNWS